jgi:hypothetical protein
VCLIRGFLEGSSALRFEYRLQHSRKKIRRGENRVEFILRVLVDLINSGDGSKEKNNKMPWPYLNIKWFNPQYNIIHQNVANTY